MPFDCCNGQEGIISGSLGNWFSRFLVTFKDINCWFAFRSTDPENSSTLFFNWSDIEIWSDVKNTKYLRVPQAAGRHVGNLGLSFLNFGYEYNFFSWCSSYSSRRPTPPSLRRQRAWHLVAGEAACHRYSKPQGLVSREIPPRLHSLLICI